MLGVAYNKSRMLIIGNIGGIHTRRITKQGTLAALRPGQSGVVQAITAQGAVKRHFLDMGITKGVTVTVERIAPFGDPIAVRLRGYSLSLRREEAANIVLEGERDADTGDHR